jgi:hypothetical protein
VPQPISQAVAGVRIGRTARKSKARACHIWYWTAVSHQPSAWGVSVARSPCAPNAPSVTPVPARTAPAAAVLVPFERHAEVIRYTFAAMEFAGGRAVAVRQVVVQLAPAANERSAELIVATGRGPLRGPLRPGERLRETIAIEEYRSLRAQIVRLAADLNLREQQVSNAVTVCSHAPWARFDMKLGGESAFTLSRTGGCHADATAYRAGDFLVTAAERIAGRPIEGARPPR